MKLYAIKQDGLFDTPEYVVAENLGVALLKWRQARLFDVDREPFSVSALGSVIQ